MAGLVKSVGSNYYTLSDGWVDASGPVNARVETGTTRDVTEGPVVTVTGIAGFSNGARAILKVS